MALYKNIVKETIRQNRNKDWEKTVDAIDDWIAIIDLDATIRRSNRTVEKLFQLRVQESIGLKCCKVVHGKDQPAKACPIPEMMQSKKRSQVEVEMVDGRWVLITVDPLLDKNGEMTGAVHIVRDITERILIQRERERLVKDLKDTLVHVKTLSGLLPICSYCKKVRDDKGYWNLIESYIESNSNAEFSHGMCPECSDKLYGEEDWYIHMKKRKGEKEE